MIRRLLHHTPVVGSYTRNRTPRNHKMCSLLHLLTGRIPEHCNFQRIGRQAQMGAWFGCSGTKTGNGQNQGQDQCLKLGIVRMERIEAHFLNRTALGEHRVVDTIWTAKLPKEKRVDQQQLAPVWHLGYTRKVQYNNAQRAPHSDPLNP